MPVRDEYLKSKNDLVDKYYLKQMVLGVGIGKPVTAGMADPVCYRLYLEKRGTTFDSHFDQFWVDTIETGRFVSFDDSFGPGTAIALDYDAPNVDPTLIGTLGAAVKIGDQWFALGANHVMAVNGRVPIGGRIMFRPQDKFIDDPSAYVVARLAAHVPLLPGAPNQVDCALAAIEHPDPLPSDYPEVDVVDPQPDMHVKLAGRNGVAGGEIEDVNARLRMDYRFGSFDLDQMVLIKSSDGPMAKPGDSGALVITDDGRQAVGIVVGGVGCYTVACYLTTALKQLVGALPPEDTASIKDPVNDPKLYLDCIRFGVADRTQYRTGPPHHQGLFQRLIRDAAALKSKVMQA